MAAEYHGRVSAGTLDPSRDPSRATGTDGAAVVAAAPSSRPSRAAAGVQVDRGPGTAPLLPSLADEEGAYRDTFRRERPVLWAVTLVGPFLATGLMLLSILLVKGVVFTKTLIGYAFATFFLFGRFVLLLGEDEIARETGIRMARSELFIMLFWMDLMTASLLVYHAGFLFRIRFIGPRLLSLAEDGRFILSQQPWMRRATFIGLILFVMFPLAATGSVGGAIFGRLLGLTRFATFVGIAIGSLVGCGTIYFGARLIAPYFDRDNPLVLIGGIAVVMGIVLLLNLRFRSMKKRARELAAAAGQVPAS